MEAIQGDKLRGHLEALVLSTLERGEAHGLEILHRLEEAGCGLLRLKEGSLYPALHRLEQQDWIKAEWRPTDMGRMAKFYSLSRSGRRQYQKELETWTRLSIAINLVVQEG